MLSAKQVLSLTELAPPVLTAYLGTGMSTPRAVNWLRQEAHSVASHLPAEDREAFHEQLNRAEEFLTDRRPKEKGIVILAGPKTWKLFPVRLSVKNELHWGKPALSQLLNLVDEVRPSLIVAMDSAGARFFRYAIGEMGEYAESKLDIDASQWKEQAHTARQGTETPHGNQRDAFKRRMDAQYLHFCREVAQRANALAARDELESVFLVGSMRLTEPIRAALPQRLQGHITSTAEDLARVPARAIYEHVGLHIASRSEEYTARRVDQLLEGGPGTVVSLDKTLAQLQNGNISTLVIARGVDQNVQQCVQCGLVDRSADPLCQACGGECRSARLGDLLPELLRPHRTHVEIANGVAGAKLRDVEGIGGWLRPPNRKE